ncbi:hypothetical protein GO013_02275 [Pseudodesulfovibrio sp. JC047]|uniref:hypothetical protein n=1 Tax=Pseudodesulfovibrio sp. JC047 TaxID=2683199 RepID=UPI0013D24036|nr:hypothetical protein [Pseudodesulfovibrio sp. JC047]NDV18245.1 hypothetical protein [Pseudodesulfovibrio sp. JC047]
MRALVALLFRRQVVLVVFMVLKIIASIFSGVTVNSNEAWGIGLLAVLTYGVIAWLAYKRLVISIWAISIIMLYEGAGTLLTSWAYITSSPALALLGLAVGAYLIFGGLVVFSSRRTSE